MPALSSASFWPILCVVRDTTPSIVFVEDGEEGDCAGLFLQALLARLQLLHHATFL
jgi:hypothetical protein